MKADLLQRMKAKSMTLVCLRRTQRMVTLIQQVQILVKAKKMNRTQKVQISHLTQMISVLRLLNLTVMMKSRYLHYQKL
uniref:Uncharacterized protein n=1 Tax=Arundo donax TaxID=35708 RepID=A0A0A9EYA2_ARUDO